MKAVTVKLTMAQARALHAIASEGYADLEARDDDERIPGDPSLDLADRALHALGVAISAEGEKP